MLPKLSHNALNLLLLLLGLLCSAAFFFISSAGDLRPRMTFFLVMFSLAFLGYSLAVALILKTRGLAEAKSSLAIILFFALCMRMLMLAGEYPHLTDDIYRYLLDARVGSVGINPFSHAPADTALAPLRDSELFPKINHPHIPTIYPPVLQAIFRLAAGISPTIFSMRALFTLFDLGTLILLILLLRAHGRPLMLSLIYAWNPLLILETAGSGHVDSAGAFFLVLVFLLLRTHHRLAGTAALALATLTKFVPAILLPWLIRKRPRRQQAGLIALFLLIILAAYLPFLSAGEKLFSALGTYSAKWEFNASLFKIIYLPVHALLPEAAVRGFAALKGLTADASTLVTFRIDLALLVSKMIAAGLFAGVFYILLKKKNGGWEIEKIWLILFGLLCILSPTLHPWYLIWLLPALVLYPERAWLLLTGSIVLSYIVVERYFFEGIWQENATVRLIIFLPFYGLLLYDHRTRLREAISALSSRAAVWQKKIKKHRGR